MSYQVSATSHWRTIGVQCSSSYKIASKLFYDMYEVQPRNPCLEQGVLRGQIMDLGKCRL